MTNLTRSYSQRNEAARALPPPQEFRLYLQGVFAQKCRANPSYSLRAFAKRLEMDHATLSQIIRGVRPISRKTIARLGERLGLDPSQVAIYLRGDRAGTSEKTEANASAKDLSLDMFSMIADWYHYALFELITLTNFKADPKWMAKMLGITSTEVTIAIERLKRLGLIEITKRGDWRQGAPLISTTSSSFTAAAFRKLQAQILTMGLQALEELPMEIRDHTSMTMAINTKRIPEAKERIRKFRRELCAFLQEDADRDAVFQLGISFYPVTKVQIKSKKESV